MNKSDTLLLCVGKDCKKAHRQAFDRLESRANKAGLSVAFVKCQGSCEGPTAVVQTKDGPRWFEKLQSDKACEQVIEFAASPRRGPAKKLTKLELTGKKRAKAAKKLAK